MATVSHVEGSPFEYSGVSLWEKFTRAARDHPDNIAIICPHQPKNHLDLTNIDLDDDSFRSSPYLRVRYRHFADAVNRFANALLQQGVRPGTPIISLLSNVVEYPIAFWATFKLGCIWVPINPRNLLNKPEISHMIKTALSYNSSPEAVILAKDQQVATGIDDLGISCQLIKIVASSEKKNSWLNYHELLIKSPDVMPRNPSFDTRLGAQDALIMFTSGTTALPKGCFMPTAKHAMAVEQRLTHCQHIPSDVVCVVAPNNHIIGKIWLYMAHAIGGTLVFPGETFNPKTMLDTMLRESCTHVGLVPTMVYALLGVKSASGSLIPSLKQIGLGGAIANPEIVEKCINGLGGKIIDNVWGMTEGCITTPAGFSISELIDNGAVSVGFPNPGTKARICAANTKIPLPCDVTGELHFSGPSVTDGYIGKHSDDFYIGDDGERWFMTGDQAKIDKRGRIFVTGRYKEMIIRGGENIAPAAVEAVLTKVPKIMSLNVQIIGAKDAIAGEVPVAIHVGKRDPEAAQSIQQLVLKEMGSAYVPDQVVSLDDLGLQDYPRTMAGKVQKHKLTAAVQEFRAKHLGLSDLNQSFDNDVAKVVRQVWHRALGYTADEHAPIVSFADSITVMRVREMIIRQTGKSIALSELVEAGSIAGIIQLIQQQSHQSQKRRAKRPVRTNPLAAEDIITFHHHPEAFGSSKVLIETELAKLDLNWNDVIDIVPAYDFGAVTCKTGISSTWTWTISKSTRMTSVEKARAAVRKTLANWPLHTALLLWNKEVFQTDEALHVMVRQTDSYLDSRIHDCGSVKDYEAVKELTKSRNYPGKDTVAPGPFFDICLVYVEETQTVAILMRLHHAIMDATSASMFAEDLNAALGGQSLPDRTDYAIWANSYYSLKTSHDARRAVDWHIKRLRGASSHREALWINSRQQRVWDDPVVTTFDAPAVVNLRRKHPHIAAPVIMKAAYALLNTYRSNYTHAVFTNWQASRGQFPFVPKSLQDLGYDYPAADVGGPTADIVFNLVEIRPQETVLDFFQRMQNDQDDLTKYAAAPLRSILSGLSEEDGAFFLAMMGSNLFNWRPGMGSTKVYESENYGNIAEDVHPDRTFGMNAGLGGEKGHTVALSFIGNALTNKQHWEVAEQVEKITLWLVDEDNWNCAVEGYKQHLGGDGNGANLSGETRSRL